MHYRLTQLLGHEVVGEVRRVDDAFYDVARGRICLQPLVQEPIDQIVEALREAFAGDVQVNDQLAFDNDRALVRGILSVELKDPETGGLYQLQITGHHLIQFYERQFALEPEIDGDLMGMVAQGICPATSKGREAPLRLIGQVDKLIDEYRSGLSETLAADRAGSEAQTEQRIGPLSEHVRRVWQLLPHPIKHKLKRIGSQAPEGLIAHDKVMRDTVMFAIDRVEGKPILDFCHHYHELEAYDEVADWMAETYESLREFYPRPRHSAAMGRASSLEVFLSHFPAHQALVGPMLHETEQTHG